MEPKPNEESKIHKIVSRGEKDLPVDKSRIAKIAGVIKSQPEMKTIKEDLADKIVDMLVDEVAKETKREGIERAKDLTKLGNEKDISTLLKQAADTIHQELEKGIGPGLKERGKKISLSTVDEIKYIMKVPKPHFDYIPKNKILSVEDSYPKTINILFEVAFGILDGSFGEKLKAIYLSEIPHEIPFNNLLIMMLIYLSKAGHSKDLYNFGPEIFNQFRKDEKFHALVEDLKNIDIKSIENWILVPEAGSALFLDPIVKLLKYVERIEVESSVVLALMKIFKSFLSNLMHPSHLLVDLLIKLKLADGAVEAALLIRNNTDRAKALVSLIDTLLSAKDFEGAHELWQIIPTKLEKSQASIKIALALIDEGHLDEAMVFAKETQNHDEYENLLREFAMCLTKQKKLNKALEVAGLIGDSDVRSYTLSLIVKILNKDSEYAEAKKIASSILDIGFKEDAYKDIINSLLQKRHFDEAVEFAGTVKNPREKQKLARMITAALKVLHEDEKVRSFTKQFPSLYGISKKPARKAA